MILVHSQFDRRIARRRLEGDLARLAKDTGFAFVVVFDGAPDADFADGAVYGKTRVFFGGDAAARRVHELLERGFAPSAVVTDARAVATRARAFGLRVVPSLTLERAIAATNAPAQAFAP